MNNLILKYLYYKDKLKDERSAIQAQIRIIELGQKLSFASREIIILNDHPLIKPMKVKVDKYKKIVDNLAKKIKEKP